jgi:glycosyltransferase involved in cell wall biosynthesis
MFSIVIPLYNKAAFVKKTVQSVLDQTFRDFELIIVNDGSTDTSLKVVRGLNDDRIRLFDQENTGVSTARNHGVKEAVNEYIAFLDADDWWDPAYLEKMQELISKYPDAGLWAAKYYKVKHGRNIEANIGLEEGFTDGYIDYFRVYARTMWMPVTSSSFTIRQSTFDTYGGYKPELKIGEDFELWSRIALKHDIAFLNRPLVYYNNDVSVHNRAVGGHKIYQPHNHFIFQLELQEEERINKDLKHLMDKLRLRSLFRYRLQNVYSEETRRIIEMVDLGAQPLSWRLKYRLPLFMLRAWFAFRLLLSNIKSSLIQLQK